MWMKNVMLNRNKSSLYVWLFLFWTALFLNIWFINAASFTERLEEMWVDVVSLSAKKSVSRYEISRLLNAANCEDCVQAPAWMRQTYSQTFWDSFKVRDDKDFDDISYGWAVWNRKSYYYCVAYVWDNGYMAWYPSTSTKCKWKFCGQDSITTSEVYQTVLNISQDKIRNNYTVNWREVKSRLSSLKRDGIEMRVLNNTNIKAINGADIKSNIAQTNDEFQAWLKYCMYNLSWCNFQRFWKIWRWYWPVSELNILYKEWIITQEDAMKVAESNSSVNGADALRIFWKVFDNYGNCTFNVDYDCDGITNGKDNCPYVYNLNQYDLDADGIGNVCDDDIDGDWERNPEWIVDDNNHIVISLWEDDLDQTPLWDSDLWFSFFINVDAISSSFPTSVRFTVLTNSNIEKIDWDFGDWTTQITNNWNRLNHTFNSYWTFTVKAVANAKGGWQAFAMTKVFIATPKSENYVLGMSPKVLFKGWGAEYTLTPLYSGDINLISWSVNNSEEKSQKVGETFKTNVKEAGIYIVSAKWYKNEELKSVAMFTIVKKTSPAFSYMTVKPWALWEETEVTTNISNIDKNNIDYITTDWWWEVADSTNLKNTHIFTEGGVKTIQQTVVLKDWTKFYSMATITIQNPLLTQSYWINVSWKRLVYNQNEKLALWLNTYPKSSILSLFTSYQLGSRMFVVAPDLSKTILDFSYSTAWDKLLTNMVEINRCVALTNQWTVHINSKDVCKTALENKTLGNYKCDEDEDGIPDICDDDIDGDGMKNLIWIISHENKDCSITGDNVNLEILKKQFWVCSLDDCPFTANLDQSDLNNNWIWDVCESLILSVINSKDGSKSDETEDILYSSDQDQDWVPDNEDNCIDVPWNSADGCPQYYNQNCWVYSSCGNGKIDEWETCQNCPEDVGMCCGNGIMEARETCDTCPEDLWDTCKPKSDEPECGNGKIDKWENCSNCKEDLKECLPSCWNGKYDKWETCQNCPEDLWECPNSCGNGIEEEPEQCDNWWENNWRDGKCTEACKLLNPSLCWNNKKEGKEECDLWEANWEYNEGKWCTIACTKFDPNKPDCGNGKIDEWEDCRSCAIDFWWSCMWKCGDNVIDVNEECDNGTDNGHDGLCTFQCKKQEDSKKYCWNKKVETWEECDDWVENGNGKCSRECKKISGNPVCGNGIVEEKWGEECDDGAVNGTIWSNCTRECKYKEICGNGKIEQWKEDCEKCAEDLWNGCKPEVKCGNGKIDEWETCGTCPKDAGVCCGNWVLDPWEECDTCPMDVEGCNQCGNGKIDKWENCSNCKEDLKECLPSCWNGKYDKWETCQNCPEDLWECPNSCGNGIEEEPEQCDNWWENNWRDGKCTEACKLLNPSLCWNNKKEGKEECDLWEANWEYNEGKWCTIACTKFDPNKPDCGNGKIDEWEDCRSCAIDFWWSCMWKCGDNVIDVNEECDNGTDNGHDGLCTFQCKKQEDSKKYCWNKKVETWEECDDWVENGNGKCSRECKKISGNPVCGNGIVEEKWGEECDDGAVNGTIWSNCTRECKYKEICGNGKIEQWKEDCEKCAEDLWNGCKPEVKCGNGKIDEWETCGTCPKDAGVCCGNWVLDPWEDCDTCPMDAEDCEKCAEDLWNGCKPEVKCGNGKIDEWETCETCPQDAGVCYKLCGNRQIDEWEECDDGADNGKNGRCTAWCKLINNNQNNPEEEGWEIASENCNTCPCEYVDFASDLVKWDSIRAKLWDKPRYVFYKYSNSVWVESFLDRGD